MKKLIDIVGFYRKADPALTITMQFVLFGMLWILFSDSALFLLAPDSVLWKLAHIHILKGLLFVGVTGGFIFYWTNQYVQAIRQKESELTSIFQTSPLPMALLDSASFRFIDANEMLTTLYGYSRKEFTALTLEDVSVEKERYEALPLLIKTGSRELGEWKQIKKDGRVFNVRFCAQPVRERKAFLITFTDVTHELEIKCELKKIKNNFEDRLNAKIEHLTRLNEELAYRASQTEHVNTELIAVNERLQMVNKKIATQSQVLSIKNAAFNDILSNLQDVLWSFDLSSKTMNYISPSAEVVFEDALKNFSTPWFWLDFVHHDDESLKSIIHQQMLDKAESSCTFRIVAKKGTLRLLYFRIKLIRDQKSGAATLIGSATDVSRLMVENDAPVMIPRANVKY